MPPPDFPPPDGFPDLTLPARTDQSVRPERALIRPARDGWRAGDHVLAPWEPHFLYAGRIAQIQDGQALIQFDDGDAGWVMLEQVRPLAVQQGQQVLSRRRMGPYHFPAEVLDVDGDEVCVDFADGQESEWTTVAALRIPCLAAGPGAAPTKVASHQAFFDSLQPGDRVWAPWDSAILFAGAVDQLNGREVHIHFDDGDRGWVLIEQLLPLDIPVGLRVMGRWNMGSQYYSGIVDEVQGDRIHIHYDDGDKEWTHAAALAVPCQPLGPSARPTKTAFRWNPLAGWLIPIGIAVVLGLTRAGCR